MRPFAFERANDPAAAVTAAGADAAYLAGGTTLLDLMKLDVMRPSRVVDITALSIRHGGIDVSNGLRIGALAKMADVAAHPAVRRDYPMIAQSLDLAASPQIRNMATVGGNLLQRTRCAYFYDDAARCNKRHLGDGCDAFGGFNRYHAILGASSQCIATHPSDMCVALAALDAQVEIQGAGGPRTIPMVDLHRLPADTPDVETVLAPGDLITAITLPAKGFGTHARYRKVRDRASYAFALVSVAAALDCDGTTIRDARLALGGVAHKPWRAYAAEAALNGRPATEATFRDAAEAELAAAEGLAHNGFKIELAKRVIVDAFVKLAAHQEIVK